MRCPCERKVTGYFSNHIYNENWNKSEKIDRFLSEKLVARFLAIPKKKMLLVQYSNNLTVLSSAEWLQNVNLRKTTTL